MLSIDIISMLANVLASNIIDTLKLCNSTLFSTFFFLCDIDILTSNILSTHQAAIIRIENQLLGFEIFGFLSQTAKKACNETEVNCF